MTNSSTLRPRLVVAGADRAIDYYTAALGAKETARYTGEDGRIVHAELTVGQSTMTLKDGDGVDQAPAPGGDGAPVLLMLEVDDADAVAGRMVAGGGRVVFPVADSEYGRGGRVADPFGHVWMLSQRPAG